MRILRLAGRRLAASIPTLVLILIGIFLLLQFAPGDTVDAMMAQMGGGDAATARELRRFYGLDLSVPVQLGHYLLRLVRLDLGFSSIYGKPVAAVLLERLPPTILLMTASLSFAFFFGLVFGVIAARGVNKWPDTVISIAGLIFYATPSFWFGLMAIVVFSIYLQWLPAGGFEDIGAVQTGIWRTLDIARHLVLPTLTLGLIFLAIYLRIMRASMLEVLNLDYVRTARAKGLDETRVVTRHVLRNALSADGDPDRAAGRNHAGRLGRGRERVLAARARPTRLRIRGPARPQHASGNRLRLRPARYPGEFRGRPHLRAA